MPPTTKITEPGTTDDQPGTDPFGRPIEAPTQTITPTHAVPAGDAPSVGVATGGDNCAACGASMAADQRYCLICGERRGQARFSAMPGATSTTTTQVREPAPERHRFSAGTTLIAGVATLLLAMGVGVLIGSESSSSPTATNPKVQVVNVGGGAAASAATTPATTSPSGGASSAKASGKSHKNNGSAKAATTASTSSAASATTVKTPPPTVTVGAKGHGPGYQHGHFTGNFFGP